MQCSRELRINIQVYTMILNSMMMGCLLKAYTTVAAWTSTWFIQIDINFGMTERASSTIANRLTTMNDPDWISVDHLHRTERVGL